MLKPVIAATAALAIAGSTFVYAQQRFDGHGGFGNGGPRAEHQHRHLSVDDISALADARIAAMKAGLELTSDQAKNWPSFEQAVRNMLQLRLQRIQARQAAAQGSQQGSNAAPTTPFDRMSHRADAMTKRGAALKQIADAGSPLYASLNDAQKARFTMLARMLRPHEHQHQHAMNNSGGQRFGQADGRNQEGGGHRHFGQAGPGGRNGQGGPSGPDGQGWGHRRFGQDGQGGSDGQQGWWGHHRFGQNGGMHNMSNSDDDSQL
jgi:zinc resistance-associated protein